MKTTSSVVVSTAPSRPKLWSRRTLYLAYLAAVTVMGIVLLGLGLLNFANYEPRLHFILLCSLAAVTAIATTSIAVSDEAGITYHIGEAIGIAAVPSFGVLGATVILVVFNLCTWLIKPINARTWKKSWTQLGFNIGTHNIAIVVAGLVLLTGRAWFGPQTMGGQTAPWLLAAFVFEVTNLWLLIGILRLQHGSDIQPGQIWSEARWAIQVGSLSMAIGGGVLAYAVQHFGWIGSTIFFLPILASSYAYRLYVRQMQVHLSNLEQIVAERTSDLAERTDALMELNRQKDAYLAVLTHDMMTPLANIQFCAEVIQEDAAISPESRHLSQLMLRSQNMLFNMVRNILDLEKLQAGGALSTQKRSCDLVQLINDTVEMIHAEAQEKGIAVQHHVPDEPMILNVDPQQMERVLLNLLSNAVKYTPLEGDVELRVSRNAQSVQIDVIDSGYGIPTVDLPYIFERFQRVKQLKDKATGTGLGLAITKALVDEHNGTITVTSEPGKGSTFSVKIPV